MSERVLSPNEARHFYDRFGAKQDSQAYYEDPATDRLVAHGGFDVARAVFELGCGTGRFAERLLAHELPAAARYKGVDLSPHMLELARERLGPYADRITLELSEGGAPAGEPDGAYDRFVSNFVLDLLSTDDVRAVVLAAYRMLEPGGRLCVTGLSTGIGPLSRVVASGWSLVHRLSPRVVGGCRPLEVERFLEPSRWEVLHLSRVAPYGIPSEIVVAERH